jgi:hypothetical protein
MSLCFKRQVASSTSFEADHYLPFESELNPTEFHKKGVGLMQNH